MFEFFISEYVITALNLLYLPILLQFVTIEMPQFEIKQRYIRKKLFFHFHRENDHQL